jgi:CDP-diacylglycerol pyrophosphatase
VRGATRVSGLAAVAALVACDAPQPGRHHDRNSLYRQMRACVAAAEPAPPCIVVDRAAGFVVIKDDSPRKPYGYLIVPTSEVTGIEDPRAVLPPADELWARGWEIGERILGRPREDIGLAVNSKAGRGQDLLHIHISCVEPAVRAALASAPIGDAWAEGQSVELEGDAYVARTAAALDPSPFLVLEEVPAARSDMAAQSLAVIGRRGGGFYLVADATGDGVVAEAERLLDQRCR